MLSFDLDKNIGNIIATLQYFYSSICGYDLMKINIYLTSLVLEEMNYIWSCYADSTICDRPNNHFIRSLYSNFLNIEFMYTCNA